MEKDNKTKTVTNFSVCFFFSMQSKLMHNEERMGVLIENSTDLIRIHGLGWKEMQLK